MPFPSLCMPNRTQMNMWPPGLFRVNAGAVHAYVTLPDDKTVYLGELRQGQEVLIVDSEGNSATTTLGRVKIEVRPMLLIEAEVEEPGGEPRRGCVFCRMRKQFA